MRCSVFIAFQSWFRVQQ